MNESKTLRCLVVDDEPPAREVLARYIAAVPALSLQGSCANALEALDRLRAESTDLLFLDIHMPQLKGTELLRILRQPPPVILTTAHPGYALEGFELDAVDYLLKPIQFDRFLKAVQKALNAPVSGTMTPVAAPAPTAAAAFIYLRVDRKMVKVPLADILFVESMKDYVKVFTTTGVLITKQSLGGMEAMLPETDFLRTHRSFIVARDKIRAFTSELLEVGKTEVPIGKLYRQQVIKTLGG